MGIHPGEADKVEDHYARCCFRVSSDPAEIYSISWMLKTTGIKYLKEVRFKNWDHFCAPCKKRLRKRGFG